MNDLIIGVEAANSTVKLCVGDKTDAYINTCRKLRPFEENTFGKKQTIFTYLDKKYVIGEYDASSSSGTGSDRYNEQYKREMLFAIAKHVRNGQIINVVTGLPSEHYRRSTLKDTISDLLKGSYEIKVDNEVKKFEIENVIVMLQPLATIVSYMMDNNGKFIKDRESIKEQKVLVIDVGFGTSDFCYLNKMNVAEYAGVNVGMLRAMNLLRESVIDKYPNIEGLPPALELNAMVENNNTISCGGEKYDITDLKEEVYSYVADEIMNGLRESGFSINEFDKVIFTGGGILSLRSYLKKYVEGKNATMLSNPQLANAQGYYKYGVNKLCRK